MLARVVLAIYLTIGTVVNVSLAFKYWSEIIKTLTK